MLFGSEGRWVCLHKYQFRIAIKEWYNLRIAVQNHLYQIIDFQISIYLCTNLKYTITILLFTALLAQTFSRSLAIADYLVNLDAYKKACVNKAKPMLHCNGKCQMLKKIKKQEGSNGTNAPAPKYNETELVLSSKSFFPSLNVISTHDITSFYTYNDDFSSIYIGTIFHPPGA